MNKQAINFAIKNQINLGTMDGYYIIRNPQTSQMVSISIRKNGQSAIVMMKKFLRALASDPKSAYWR
jgi:hypothetical protein